ncbi:MAG: putative lipoprotein, partial [Myxococcota bacterium]
MVTTCFKGPRMMAPHVLRATIIALLLTVGLTAYAPPAHAQDRLSQARDHFERGKEHYKQRQYDLALEQLMKAYVLDPKPALVY